MIVVDEYTAACNGTMDGGRTNPKTSGTWTEGHSGWTKRIRTIGCGFTLPRWMFSDARLDTVCDMCKWRLKIERARIVQHYDRLRAAYPYENAYQRKIQKEAAADWAETRESYIQAGVEIQLRGEKITLERLATEVGANSKSTAYTYFQEGPPSKVIKRLADQRLQETANA